MRTSATTDMKGDGTLQSTQTSMKVSMSALLMCQEGSLRIMICIAHLPDLVKLKLVGMSPMHGEAGDAWQ